MNPSLLLVFGMLISTPLWAAARVLDIPLRPGVTQRILLLESERPSAVLLVFAGGDHALGIRDDGSLKWGGGSLLVRTSPIFLQRGFTVAIVDMPSDRQAEAIDNFRESIGHGQDIATVINFFRRDNSLPIWLIGTSSGTTSVLNAAIHLQKNSADGIVLATGVAADSGSALAAQLDEIRIPTLVVRKGDPCRPVQSNDSSGIIAALTNAPKAEEIVVQSVVEKGADPCTIPPVHGYLGMEEQFVDKISDWIKPSLRRRDII